MPEPIASHNDWMQAFGRVYVKLPVEAHEPCPNCGQDALRVVFVGRPGASGGYGFFWCDNCLFGVWISRVDIPDGVEAIPRIHASEELAKSVPDITIVGGSSEGDERFL